VKVCHLVLFAAKAFTKGTQELARNKKQNIHRRRKRSEFFCPSIHIKWKQCQKIKYEL
jgi:hypothetical protein